MLPTLIPDCKRNLALLRLFQPAPPSISAPSNRGVRYTVRLRWGRDTVRSCLSGCFRPACAKRTLSRPRPRASQVAPYPLASLKPSSFSSLPPREMAHARHTFSGRRHVRRSYRTGPSRSRTKSARRSPVLADSAIPIARRRPAPQPSTPGSFVDLDDPVSRLTTRLTMSAAINARGRL